VIHESYPFWLIDRLHVVRGHCLAPFPANPNLILYFPKLW